MIIIHSLLTLAAAAAETAWEGARPNLETAGPSPSPAGPPLPNIADLYALTLGKK